MEDEKKKKRNKKKKNKQNKTTNEDDVTRNGQIEEEQQQQQKSVSVSEEALDSNAVHTDHRSNGEHSSILVESDKEQWNEKQAELENTIKRLEDESNSYIQKETALEETIKQLQAQNNSHALKEASLEETIQSLRNANDSYQQKQAVFATTLRNANDLNLQKQASLEETVKMLRDANESYLKKQASLEETIKELRNTIDSYMQKQASLEETIQALRHVNDSSLEKQAIFEETIDQLREENNLCKHNQADLGSKVEQLLSEKDSLLQKEEALELKLKQLENEKDSWILLENSNKETIGRMNVDIARLQMQVVELEESRNVVMKENHQLLETISSLQSQLQTGISSGNNEDQREKHSAADEDLKAQIESASTLIGRLIAENAELVEKVNELCAKLQRETVAADLPPSSEANPSARNAEIASISDHASESGDKISASGLHPVLSQMDVLAPAQFSSEAELGEIVQIPLDDGQNQDLELQSAQADEKEAVPLTDAPLIGAPFRLISFVASYVSGADLVNSDH